MTSEFQQQEPQLKGATVVPQEPTPAVPTTFSLKGIYSAVKEGTVSVPYGIDYLHKVLEYTSLASKFVSEKTPLNIHFTVDNVYELINKLDQILQEQLSHADDGLGELRGKVIVKLHDLMAALTKYKNLTADSTKQAINTRYENFVATLNQMVDTVKTKYPETYHSGEALVARSYGNVADAVLTTSHYAIVSKNILVDAYGAGQQSLVHAYDEGRGTVYGTIYYALKYAQPYVHRAVNTGTPYVSRALEISQPYVEKAKPYLDPIVDKANGYKHSLEEHQLLGPYVKKGVDLAQTVYGETTAYAIPPAH